MTDNPDDLQTAFVAARERLSAARATLDQFGPSVGSPVEELPAEHREGTDPAYDAARREYDEANAAFVELEARLRPQWAEQAETPVESGE